jgi:hypothetical protein
MPMATSGSQNEPQKGTKNTNEEETPWMFRTLILLLITSASTQTPTLADISWISGDWQTASGGKAQIEEHWTPVAGATMMGMSRTVAGEKTVEFEYLRIEQRADGIFYVAHPKARCPGTDFKLTRASATEAIFENPQHDFPKRIIYRKTADDSLTATIDGGEGTKAMSFSFRRVKP